MLRENIAKIASAFISQLNGKGGNYLLKVPSAAEKVLYTIAFRNGGFARFEYEEDKAFRSMNIKAYDEVNASVQGDDDMEHNEAIQFNKTKDAKALVYSKRPSFTRRLQRNQFSKMVWRCC